MAAVSALAAKTAGRNYDIPSGDVLSTLLWEYLTKNPHRGDKILLHC